MRKTIDNELIHLISNYDKSEIEIRREEEYLSLVKFFEGDEEKAKKEMLIRESKRQQHKLDFIEQMASEITSGYETTPSKRRTAVTFLSNYINRGYDKYIDGAKKQFPNSITLNVDQWSGSTSDGLEFDTLSADYGKKMNEVREEAVNRAANVKPKVLLILAIATFVLGIVAFICMPNIWFAGAGMLVAGAVMLILRAITIKNIDKNVAKINKEFSEKIIAGKIKLDTVMNQWRDARAILTQYDSEGEHKVA